MEWNDKERRIRLIAFFSILSFLLSCAFFYLPSSSATEASVHITVKLHWLEPLDDDYVGEINEDADIYFHIYFYDWDKKEENRNV